MRAGASAGVPPYVAWICSGRGADDGVRLEGEAIPDLLNVRASIFGFGDGASIIPELSGEYVVLMAHAVSASGEMGSAVFVEE